MQQTTLGLIVAVADQQAGRAAQRVSGVIPWAVLNSLRPFPFVPKCIRYLPALSNLKMWSLA